MNFIDQIKKQFKEGSILTRLIIINLAVFAFVILVNLASTLGGFNSLWLREYLAFPANIDQLIEKPWTVITYMFTHLGFLHIAFNLLALYIFGQLFLRWLDPDRLLAVYILGGISGAAIYIAAYNLFPGLVYQSSYASVIGASASIYAIMVSTASLTPKHKVGIPMLAQIELQHLVLIFLGIDVVSIAFNQENIGGHFAHLGGALFGFLFGYLHKNGMDISSWLTVVIKNFRSLFKKKEKIKVSYKKNNSNRTRKETDMEYNARKKSERDQVNRILDKIGKSGYDSLSKKEKEILFKSSNKN